MRAYKNSRQNKSQKDARVHCAVLNVRPDTPHTTPPTQTPRKGWWYEIRKALTQEQRPRPQGLPPPAGPLPQDPTACLRTDPPHPPRSTPDTSEETPGRTRGSHSHRPNWSAFHPRAPPHTLRRHPKMGTDHGVGAALDHFQRGKRPVLLRKEVIQPHLPVRLPCYDFVPIADPAFDGSLHKGWATGFGRYRLS